MTGGSRGIGRAIAAALRARGAEVAIVARTVSELESAANAMGAAAIVADIAVPADVERLTRAALSHFGDAPDIVVNVAGAFGLSAVAETSAEAFDAMIAANLRAPFMLMRGFLPRMIERGSGSLVSIGSIAGRSAFPGNGAYSASKFGLRGLHEVLEQELKGTGVRSILIEPAATDTTLWDSVERGNEETKKRGNETNSGLPQRSEMLSAEAVAECVLFALERPDNVAIKYMGLERA